MGFVRDRLESFAFETRAQVAPQSAVRDPGGGTVLSITSRTAAAIPAAQACVTILSETLARLPWQVVQRERVRLPVRPSENLIAALLLNPSRDTDPFTFWNSMLRDLFMRGNAYAVIERNQRNEPLRLQQAGMNSIQRDRGQWLYELRVPSDKPGGMFTAEDTIVAPSANVLHFRWSHYDRLRGVSDSPITNAARSALALYEAGARHQESTLLRGAHSPVAVELDASVQGAALEKAREAIKASAGVAEAGKVTFLPPGSKMVRTGFHSADMQLIELLRFSIQDIARVWGVPLYALQSMEGSSGGWVSSNLSEQFAAFVRLSLSSHVARITSELDAKLMSATGRARYSTHIDTSPLTAGTLAEQATVAETLVARAAVMTPNEAREMLGRPPIDGGDALRTPAGSPAQDRDSEG